MVSLGNLALELSVTFSFQVPFLLFPIEFSSLPSKPHVFSPQDRFVTVFRTPLALVISHLNVSLILLLLAVSCVLATAFYAAQLNQGTVVK